MRNQSPQIPQYPSPTDKSSVSAQFALTNTNTHSHSKAAMDGGQINYNNLVNTPKLNSIATATIGTVTLGTTGAVTLNPSLGNIFTITPTANTQITPTSFPNGSIMVVRVLTSGTTSYTITFNTGFVANGTLATGTVTAKYFTVSFVCDGVYWIELSRTPAMSPT